MSTVGGDPDEVDLLAGTGRAQGFTLDHCARRLDRVARWHRTSTPGSLVDARPAAARLAHLVTALVDLDLWTARVAMALRTADVGSFATYLLALGPRHQVQDATSRPPTRTTLRSLPDDDLASLGAIPHLPVRWRDGVHRERARRWIDALDERLAAVPPGRLGPGPVDRFVAWLDRIAVDRLSVAVDLHVTHAETVDRLRDEAVGVRRLLRHPDLTILSFDVLGGRPTMRVAFGEVDAADRLTVFLPGTGSGLHALDTALVDAAALHDHATRLAPDARIATVLDLYAAPLDLGAAADPTPSRDAGAATGAFLTDLRSNAPITLVGHSYGAVAASRASDTHPVEHLVLLGAPGVGVLHRRELTGAAHVWAAQAQGDPITAVADLDEHLRRLPAPWRPASGPLADPLVAHGPDPADADFGARALPTSATGPGVSPPPSRGHLEYLRPGTVSLDSVARIAAGHPSIAPR